MTQEDIIKLQNTLRYKFHKTRLTHYIHVDLSPEEFSYLIDLLDREIK